MSKLKLDLACGNNLQDGFVGVDITTKGTQATYACNLTTDVWPFEDNSVDETFSSHFLEHIPHGNGFEDPFWHFFNELYRVLKKGGTATFVTPYYSSVRAWQDPTHQRAISENTYFYLSKKWRKLNKLTHYPINANFDVVSMNHSLNASTQGKSQEAVQLMGVMNINVIDDIQVTIVKK